MKVGIILPQGWTGEYTGLTPRGAWQQTLEVAQAAEKLGFESLWVFDHFHTTPEPTDELTFEAYATLAAVGALTRRIRLGQLVTCAAYRNPALLAKMVSTLDTITAGRIELGLGAGWKEEEFRAYGYGFPPLRERQELLRDVLEIVSAMFADGRAWHDGAHASVEGAINVPKPIQDGGIPILVGGNGRDVTWRLAARYADELNLDAMPPDDLPEAIDVIRARCEEIDRDPASLRVSVHIWWQQLESARSRAALLAAYREAGVSRVMALVREAARSTDALMAFRDDVIEAGAELAPSDLARSA